MGIITGELWPQLSLVKNPRDIYMTQICSKSLGTHIFSPISCLFLQHCVCLVILHISFFFYLKLLPSMVTEHSEVKTFSGAVFNGGLPPSQEVAEGQ